MTATEVIQASRCRVQPFPPVLYGGLVSSTSTRIELYSEMGITRNTRTGRCAAIADQSGLDRDFAAANGSSAAQPRIAHGQLGGRSVLEFDGLDDIIMMTGFNLPAPGTNDYAICAVIRQTKWRQGARFWGTNSGSAAHELFQNTSSPDIAQFNPQVANNSSAAAIGEWVLLWDYRSNSTNDILQVGSAAPETGESAGNRGSTGFRIGGSAQNNCAAFMLWRFVMFDGLPTIGERNTIRAAVDTETGGRCSTFTWS